MIVSLNWLKKYTDIDLPVDELVELIGSRLVEVESVKDIGEKYKDVIVAQVILTQKVDGSDHLSQVLIDDDGVAQGVERDESGFIQVVCGAPNVRSGMMIAWLPPGSVVPSTLDSAEPFILEPKTLMGVKSNGMIASAKELDLYDEHIGILELSPDVKPGQKFADLFELNDYLIDIENKSLTTRPDTFGVIGFAREIAGITGNAFKTPDWLNDQKSQPNGTLDTPNVFIDNPELAESYQLVVVDGGFSGGKTPDEIKSYLSRVGVRPVNPIVDATNYMMLVTGQPLHAFDYDKLIAISGGIPDIHVRSAREGEILHTLDDKKLTLNENDIVIAANDQPIALAGAIGGMETAVDEDTKTIALESATFNLYKLRNTQMRHGIFSEAITRFTKGQPSQLNGPVMMATLALLDKWATVTNTSKKAVATGDQVEKQTIIVSPGEISKTLATDLDVQDIKSTLENIEFKVSQKGGAIEVTAPWWRQDITIKEDVIEEVGRLLGYDNITPTLPVRSLKAVNISKYDAFKRKIGQTLSGAGGNEVLNYSFIPGKMMDHALQDKTNAYKIVNSISPELEYYRLSLMPSLLKATRMNLKQGYEQFMLYELNKVHALSRGLTDDAVPVEGYNLAGVVYHKEGLGGAEYFQAKYVVDYLLAKLNIEIAYEPLDLNENSLSMFSPFEPKRSAMLKDKETGDFIGVVGEYKKSVRENFKLPETVAGFELNLIKLYELYERTSKSTYSIVSKYPKVQRDLCFRVSKSTKYQLVNDAVKSASRESQDEVAIKTEPVDIYSEEGSETKNITIKITLQPSAGTLDNEQINKIINTITAQVRDSAKAELV